MKFSLTEIILLMAVVAVLTLLARALFINRKSKIAHFANVGEGTAETGHKQLLGDTSNAPLTTSRYLLVKTSTDADHFTTCGTGDIPIGVNQDVYDSNNTDVPCNIAILGAVMGTQRVVTDGTIASGNYIKTGANGQATVSATATQGTFGVAFFGTDTTSAAGDIITFIPTLPSKLAF